MTRRPPSRISVRMGWKIVRLVNLRHLLTRPGRAALTVFGIGAAVALVVSVSVINETLRATIARTTAGLAGRAALEISPASGDHLSAGVAARIARTPEVATAVPMSKQTTTLSAGGQTRRTMFFGVPANVGSLFPDGAGTLERRSTPLNLRSGVFLSQELADDLGAAPGERADIRTATGVRGVVVAGVIANSPFGAVNGGSFVLLRLGQAERLFGQIGQPSVVYATTAEGASLSMVAQRLRRRLGSKVLVRPPGSAAAAYGRTFDSIASVSEQARSVALLVALFLVFNTMSMALAERRRELTLLCLGGADRRAVMGAFVVEAMVLGIAGAILGVAGGVGLGYLLVQRAVDSYAVLPFITPGSLQVGFGTALLGLGAGTGVAVAAAILSGRRILRVEPIEALRPVPAYERDAEARRSTGPLILAGVLLAAVAVGCAGLASATDDPAFVGLSLVSTLTASALLLPALAPAAIALLRRPYEAFPGMVGRLASDTLRRNPRRFNIAAGALALSTAFAIAVGGVLDSYRHELHRAANAWNIAPLYVIAPGSIAYRSDQPLPDSLAHDLSRVPGVRGVYPIRFGLVDGAKAQSLLYAIPIAAAARAGDRISEGVGISEAALTAALSRGEAVVSTLMARRRHLRVGGRLRLPGASASVRIGGLFDDVVGFDSMYVELSDYRRTTGDRLANRFAVTTGHDPVAVAHRLERALHKRHVPASVQSREESRAGIVASLDGVVALAEGIQGAALLIAGLVVLNTMLTTSFERRREFGLQRTFGMSRFQLSISLMLEAVGISVVGTALAVALGSWLGCLMILSIADRLGWQISYSPTVSSMAIALAASLTTGITAALYPGWQATRQRLVQLVQFE